MENKIISYLGVSLKYSNGTIEVLGKICPIYKELGVEKSKEKFVTDREMVIRDNLTKHGVKFSNEFNLEKSMNCYIFW